MFSFDSLGHINVVVPDLEEATRFYQTLFNASVEQTFPHFKNVGFARSVGFLEDRLACVAGTEIFSAAESNWRVAKDPETGRTQGF